MLFNLSSSDDDFVDPGEGPSKSQRSKNPTADDVRKQKQNERAAKYRAKKSDEEKRLDAKAGAERKKESRANRSSEKAKQDRDADAQRRATSRAERTPEQLQRDRNNARNIMQRLRLPSLTSISLKDGLRTQEIFEGKFRVAPLEDTEDSIGTMSVECQHCGARKFPEETSTTCCTNGKVTLTPFPRPPEDGGGC